MNLFAHQRLYALQAFMMSICLFWSFAINAKSLDYGRKLVKSGQYKRGSQMLIQALKKTSRPSSQAEIYKWLGISAYENSQKSQAYSYFKKALHKNRRVNISTSESKNKALINYFRRARASYAKSSQGSGASKSKSNSAARTRVLIKSNISAVILIDGILVGNTGIPIEVNDGDNLLIVKAKGYKTKRLKVKAVAKKLTTYAITMEVKVSKKPKGLTSRSQKNSKSKMFSEPEPRFQKPSQKSPSLVQEFAKDQSPTPSRGYTAPAAAPPGSTYPPPAPAYAYPPPTPAYAYPPAPVYPVQPVPAYPVQPAPMYSAPPPPAAPPPYVDPTYNSGVDMASPPPPEYYRESSRRKKRKSRKKLRTQSGSVLVTLLPFGAGQYQNGDSLLGAFFTAAELGSLIGWYYYDQEASATLADAEKIANDPAYDTSDENRELQKQNIDALNNSAGDSEKMANLFLGSFFVLWAGGAIEAYVNQPAPQPRRRRFSEVRDGWQLDLRLSQQDMQIRSQRRLSPGAWRPLLVTSRSGPMWGLKYLF